MLHFINNLITREGVVCVRIYVTSQHTDRKKSGLS